MIQQNKAFKFASEKPVASMNRRRRGRSLLCTVVLSLGVLSTGCAGVQAPYDSGEEPQSSSVAVQPPITQTSFDTRIHVADARLYRGEVEELLEDGFVLHAVPGPDFGAQSLIVHTSEHTQFNLDDKKVPEVGDFIEVYYGTAPGSVEVPAQVDAIVYNWLSNSYSDVVFNGELVLSEQEEYDRGKALVVADIQTKNRVIFFIADKTRVQLNLDSLVEGDLVSVLYNGTLTRSYPGRGHALEISKLPEQAVLPEQTPVDAE